MASFEDREGRALVVVDAQVGILGGAYQHDDVLRVISELLARARSAAIPVVWVQHHDEDLERGSSRWQWAGGLAPIGDEAVVEKSFGDAFADTDLETVLAERSVAEFVLVGAASEQCIRCTLHSGVVRGYDVALVQGGHTTMDMTAYGLPEPRVVVDFINAIAQFGMQWPGRAGRLVSSGDVGF